MPKSASPHSRRNLAPLPTLRAELTRESTPRTTLSFYRYVLIDSPHQYRDTLWDTFSTLSVRGRIYIATEGINAQISIPTSQLPLLRTFLDTTPYFQDIPFKVGLLQTDDSFLKLTIKVKKRIVADGLAPADYDVTTVGTHLSAAEWNRDIADPDTLVIDVRNDYESAIGHFENAHLPPVATFREELPYIASLVRGHEHRKIRLYCTGGIRCEKASAYLKARGCTNVGQLHGGIIQYAHDVRTHHLPNYFRGANFVFDTRLSERITSDILTTCSQCPAPCDTYTNCQNPTCNRLFIQCPTCSTQYHGHCSASCQQHTATTLPPFDIPPSLP